MDKPLASGNGLPPHVAVYATQTDHRRQVECADARRRKKQISKRRRLVDQKRVDEFLDVFFSSY